MKKVSYECDKLEVVNKRVGMSQQNCVKNGAYWVGMLLGDSATEIEVGCLRIGIRFWIAKRRKNAIKRGSFTGTREEYYELALYFDKGYCDKEEEYQLIPEGE